MKTQTILSFLLSILLTVSVPNLIAKEIIKDENIFIQKFTEAMKANDHTRMKELVKKAEFVVYKTVISQAEKGIRSVVEGKDGSEYFNLAESIAAIYTMESKKEGLLKLVRKYRVYDKAMCEEKLKGDALIDEGFVFYKKGKLEEALSSWKEALKIFENLVDLNGKSRALNNIAVVYDQFGQHDKTLSYYQQGLEITRMADNKWVEATILINIGEIYWAISK